MCIPWLELHSSTFGVVMVAIHPSPSREGPTLQHKMLKDHGDVCKETPERRRWQSYKACLCDLIAHKQAGRIQNLKKQPWWVLSLGSIGNSNVIIMKGDNGDLNIWCLSIILDYSGGWNTEQVRYSDGPQLFGSGPNHSKSEHSKWPL